MVVHQHWLDMNEVLSWKHAYQMIVLYYYWLYHYNISGPRKTTESFTNQQKEKYGPHVEVIFFASLAQSQAHLLYFLNTWVKQENHLHVEMCLQIPKLDRNISTRIKPHWSVWRCEKVENGFNQKQHILPFSIWNFKSVSSCLSRKSCHSCLLTVFFWAAGWGQFIQDMNDIKKTNGCT